MRRRTALDAAAPEPLAPAGPAMPDFDPEALARAMQSLPPGRAGKESLLKKTLAGLPDDQVEQVRTYVRQRHGKAHAAALDKMIAKAGTAEPAPAASATAWLCGEPRDDDLGAAVAAVARLVGP